MSLGALRAALHRRPGRWAEVVRYAEVSASTNDDARAGAAEGVPEGTLFVAERQTAGRGRAGKAWFSPARENAYLSLVLRPPVELSTLAPLPLVVGLAVAEVLDRRLPDGRSTSLKWPNDLWIDGGKVGGVLVESTVRGRTISAIVGVGINVATRRFPDDSGYAAPPTSLALAGAADLDRPSLVAEVVRALEARVSTFYAEGLTPFLEALRARDAIAGRRVRGERVEGTARGIDAEGRLVVETEDGTRVGVMAGEVRLV